MRGARAYGLDEPATDVILAELRERWRLGLKHLHGDHDVPIDRRPDLRLDLDNYRTLCNECHSVKTLREQRGWGHAESGPTVSRVAQHAPSVAEST